MRLGCWVGMPAKKCMLAETYQAEALALAGSIQRELRRK